MKRSLILFVLLSLSAFMSANAENAPRERRLGVYVNTGLFSSAGKWWYEHVNENGREEATPFFGAGLQYNIGHIYSSPVGVAIEVNEIQIRVTQQGSPEHHWGAAEASGYVVPVELWGYVSSPGRFGPFIGVAIGQLKTRLIETFTAARYTDNVYESWSFSYDYGGGLRFSASERFDLMAYVVGPTATNEITVIDQFGNAQTITAPRGYLMYGFRVMYRF